MSLRLLKIASVIVTALSLASIAGCAQPEDSTPGVDTANGSDSELKAATDAALEGKLKGILKDVTFTSESDYPYVVFEGDTVTEARLSSKLVRQKLQEAVKQQSSSHRDILPTSCRSERVSISKAISDGDAAEVPTNHDDDNYTYAHHDKQLGIALKVMRANLKSVVGFTFGTNESGDEDEVGPVLYVYVGISKTSGKLIAIMTEAVYT